ncbi:MAG: hypothetical protein ACE145_16955 [Terriglobia bacterium]
MMKRSSTVISILVLAGLLAVPTTARGDDPQFKAIVHRIQSHYHKRPMRFMGLVSFIANRARPEGIRNIKLAIFEGLESSRHPTAPDLDAFMQGIAGPEFHPFVRVRSRHDGEQTYIYAKELGSDYELLVVTLEPGEAVVVKMRVNPDKMQDWMDEPLAMSRRTPVCHGAGR